MLSQTAAHAENIISQPVLIWMEARKKGLGKTQRTTKSSSKQLPLLHSKKREGIRLHWGKKGNPSNEGNAQSQRITQRLWVTQSPGSIWTRVLLRIKPFLVSAHMNAPFFLVGSMRSKKLEKTRSRFRSCSPAPHGVVQG